MGDYTPAAGNPASLSFQAGAPIEGGQLLAVDATGAVEPCGAAGAYVGVAANDVGGPATPAVVIPDVKVTVLSGAGVIHESLSTAAIAAGAFVNPGANGAVTGGGVGTSTVGVCVRAGDPAATPPVLCRWLSWK